MRSPRTMRWCGPDPIWLPCSTGRSPTTSEASNATEPGRSTRSRRSPATADRPGDRLFIRYIRPFIQASQRHPDAPRLTVEQVEAMDAYDALVKDPDNRVEMALRPGEIQFVNNYHVLHGRRSYVDDPERGHVRWLKRLWLATDVLGPDDRPERFQRVGAMGHWGERRTRA